jgi:hypothetical protein
VGAVHFVDGKQQIIIGYKRIKELSSSLHGIPSF